MAKKIVITGGLGYIGTELCKIYSGIRIWCHTEQLYDYGRVVWVSVIFKVSYIIFQYMKIHMHSTGKWFHISFFDICTPFHISFLDIIIFHIEIMIYGNIFSINGAYIKKWYMKWSAYMARWQETKPV